uniref:Uncharacterized protein n=1 Tax=Rhizophora mucronata TaxID=61149 RepID=A0A2P2PC60_RHIMU
MSSLTSFAGDFSCCNTNTKVRTVLFKKKKNFL